MCLQLTCILYANMNLTGLAGPRSVHLWIDMPLEVRPDKVLDPGLDQVQWKT